MTYFYFILLSSSKLCLFVQHRDSTRRLHIISNKYNFLHWWQHI